MVDATAGQGPHQIADQDLTGFGVGAQPCRLDDRGTEPVAVFERGIAGTQPDPHLQWRAVGPTIAAVDCTLHLDGAGEGI